MSIGTREYMIEHQDLLSRAADVDDLNPQEEQFIEDLQKKFKRLHDLMTISERQFEWLEKIAARASR
jgi:hypothetical protein